MILITFKFDINEFILTSNLLFTLAEGHIVMYDREAPFELRIQDPNSGPQEVGTLEAIRVKILNLVSIELRIEFIYHS